MLHVSVITQYVACGFYSVVSTWESRVPLSPHVPLCTLLMLLFIMIYHSRHMSLLSVWFLKWAVPFSFSLCIAIHPRGRTDIFIDLQLVTFQTSARTSNTRRAGFECCVCCNSTTVNPVRTAHSALKRSTSVKHDVADQTSFLCFDLGC